jgi:endonuclease/exonuclease/phosphatase family metal-dependent hydrolase
VEVKLGGSSCWAFSTHLGLLPANNILQIEHLQKWVSEISGDRPALIGGDFNAHESTEQIEQISRQWIDTFRWLHPEKQVSSHTLRWPWGSPLRSHRLDYLFFKPQPSPWIILEASYLEHGSDPYSDHKALITCFNPGSLN